MELCRSYEHLNQRRSNRPAHMDSIEGADLSAQEILCGVDFHTANYVNAPQNGNSSVILTGVLGSVSPRAVSLSIGTELNTLTT